jgi:hypothetical protein
MNMALRLALATIFMMKEEIAGGMVCFFHQKSTPA